MVLMLERPGEEVMGKGKYRSEKVWSKIVQRRPAQKIQKSRGVLGKERGGGDGVRTGMEAGEESLLSQGTGRKERPTKKGVTKEIGVIHTKRCRIPSLLQIRIKSPIFF